MPDHRTGHTETRFHENTGGTALPWGTHPSWTEGWVPRSFSWEATGGWDAVFLEKELDVF